MVVGSVVVVVIVAVAFVVVVEEVHGDVAVGVVPLVPVAASDGGIPRANGVHDAGHGVPEVPRGVEAQRDKSLTGLIGHLDRRQKGAKNRPVNSSDLAAFGACEGHSVVPFVHHVGGDFKILFFNF